MWLLLVCWGSPRVRGPEDIQISRPCWLASSCLARPSHKPASFRMKTCRKRRAKKTIAAPQIKILYWHLYHIVVCLVSVINDHPLLAFRFCSMRAADRTTNYTHRIAHSHAPIQQQQQPKEENLQRHRTLICVIHLELLPEERFKLMG